MKLAAALALLLTACECPTNDSGVAVVADKYALEMTAACAAVPGCALEFMASVKVYEARTRTEVQRACSNDDAFGCYCERIDCRSIILLNPSGSANHYDSNALHEAVHAALASVGIESHDHGYEFEASLARARVLLRAELGLH